MKADFLDAHNRHWKDAELLFNAKRWANADHLSVTENMTEAIYLLRA